MPYDLYQSEPYWSNNQGKPIILKAEEITPIKVPININTPSAETRRET